MGRSEPALGHKSVVRQGRVQNLEGARLRDSCQRLESRQTVGATGIGLPKPLRCLGLPIPLLYEGGDRAGKGP